MDLLQWMCRWQMLPPNGGIMLCAVSGGRDSMCLLHYLHAVAQQRGFTVAAAHFNHRMRPEANDDEAFVRNFCREREIPFYTDVAPVYEKAQEWKLSVEETGRRLRYAFLSRTAEQIGAARIATAHHAGDNAETVLLNLLRGSGSEGLGGIPPVRGKFVRPLLQTERSEIERYCEANAIAYVEDSTNFDTHYARARLRLELWPQLEGINSAVTAALGRTAALLREESAFLDELAAARLPDEGTTVPRAVLSAEPEVLQRRMVRQMLDRLPTGKKDVSAAHIAAALALVQKGRGSLTLPDGARIELDAETVVFCEESTAPGEMVLREGENRWGAFAVTLSRACDGLTVRSWKREDRLQTKTGARSLKRLFSDAGISPAEREKLPVVCLKGVPQGVYLREDPCYVTLPVGGAAIEIMITKEKILEDSNNG